MFRLLRYFSIASAVALIAVTISLVYLYRDNVMEGLVVSAESQNITLARSFANILWPRFSRYVMTVSETDGDGLRARPETVEIDEAVRTLTVGLPVLKVKIYNLDGRTIYSSQPGQIGADKSNNLGFLKSARAGKPASKFSFRENFSAFSGEVFNRSLVESYLPIWGDDDAIEGVFELYTDVTPQVAMIDRRTDRLTVGLLITFAVLYGILFLIVRRADHIIKRQYADQLESEARFRAVVDNSPTKIHIKDAEGRYTLVNPVAEKLFGFTDEEVRGKTSYDIFPKEVADAFTAHDRQVAESGEMAEQVEQFTVEDSIRTFLTVKFPIPDGLGGVAGVAAIGTDITERKRAEEAMREAKEQAELANRTKSEFLATMSHELRTPLNAILGFSELMGNATLGPLGNPKYQEYAKDINDSGQHLLGLIQDILDLSKIEAGKLELDEEDIDVTRAIRSCMVLVKERAKNGGVKLLTDIPDGLPALHADQRKLKQILVNLLSNAVKFTPAGGEVTLKAWWREDSGYVLQVIDTGIGIALADIPTVLSPFGQVDSRLARKYEGAGLGLPLTKSFVEMHGGSLDLQSEEGAGTTVTVRFPKERIVHLPEAAETGLPAAV